MSYLMDYWANVNIKEVVNLEGVPVGGNSRGYVGHREGQSG